MGGRQRLYSVPRKLDLSSLFVFTTGFGLLFAVMNALHAGAVSFAIVAGFFTCVGASQAIFFGGKAPRLASCAAGAVYYIVVIVGFSDQFSLSRTGVVFVLLFGAAVGYVSGACIGGVFLIADALRQRLRSAGNRESHENSEG